MPTGSSRKQTLTFLTERFREAGIRPRTKLGQKTKAVKPRKSAKPKCVEDNCKGPGCIQTCTLPAP